MSGKPPSPKLLEDFCQLRHSGLSIEKAARQVKISAYHGKRWAKRPEVKARIKAIGEEYGKGVTEKRVQKTVLEITFDRNDLIMRLAQLAGLGSKKPRAETERSQVAALTVLSDIFLLRPKGVSDLKRFIGWTQDEIDSFGVTGVIPERVASLIGTSDVEALVAPESFRTDKHKLN